MFGTDASGGQSRKVHVPLHCPLHVGGCRAEEQNLGGKFSVFLCVCVCVCVCVCLHVLVELLIQLHGNHQVIQQDKAHKII